MPDAVAIFRLDSETAGRAALAAVGGSFRTRPANDERRRQTFLDTFDWRLFRDGGTLCLSNGRGPAQLVWRSLHGTLLYRASVVGEPAFAEDLAVGPFRDRLSKSIKMRRLLPLVRVDTLHSEAAILDARQKTVARVALVGGTARRPDAGGGRRKLPWTLAVTRLRGYEKLWDRLVRFGETELGLERVAATDLELALNAVGRAVCDVPAKQAYHLQPGMRADEALKSIFRSLLATIRLNQDGVRRDLDIEFLHDFRVAVRRTRSALSQLPGIFPQRVIDRYRRGFAWLGDVTGPLRDLDVYLFELPRHLDANAEFAGDLEPLAKVLRRDRLSALRRVHRTLDSARYDRFLEAWERFLAEPVPARSRLPNSLRPIDALASERIARSYRRVLRKGKRIERDSPPEALHKLRIEAKKLRYLLEFFSVLYPVDFATGSIRDLKKLQDHLGEINDLAVQSAMLKEMESRLATESDSGPSVIAAARLLRRELSLSQARLVTTFHKRFETFARPGVKKRFRALVASTESVP